MCGCDVNIRVFVWDVSIYVCQEGVNICVCCGVVNICVFVLDVSIYVCYEGVNICVLWRFQQSCVRLIDNRICKANFECEHFLFLLPCKLRKLLVKCRPTNDYLPVEVRNWNGVQRSKRYYNNWR